MKLTYNDKNHSYWLDGVRCKSITAIAKIPDDTYALEQWRKRMVAIGMASNPALVERAAAHYDDRDQLDQIAEEAMQAAKAHDAAGRGTAAHRITERIDLAQGIIDTPLSRAVADAWRLALDQADLEIVPEFIERIVVYPDEKVCGKFDRIVRRRNSEQLYVVDVKTGEGALRYPHSIAVQLALYTNAPLLAGPLPPSGGTTTDFEPLPDDLDRFIGLAVHMPSNGTVEVAEIDIEAGWWVARKIVFPVLEWRRRSDLVRPRGSMPVTGPLPVEEPDTDDTSERRAVLHDRLNAAAQAARSYARQHWPADIPSLRGDHPHTTAELDRIEALLGHAHRSMSIPETSRALKPAPPPAAKPTYDEGGPITVEEAETVRAELHALPAANQMWVQALVVQCRRQGTELSLTPTQRPTRRRLAIAGAIVALAGMATADDPDHEDQCRELLSAVMGTDVTPSMALGQALARLTLDEAGSLLAMARAAAPSLASLASEAPAPDAA